MFRFASIVMTLFVGALFGNGALAGPFQLSLGARFVDPTGKPLEGKQNLRVQFYRSATGGSPLSVGPVVLSDVESQDGVVQITINLTPSEFHTVFDGAADTWLEIENLVTGLIYPRQKYWAVPYALKVPVDGTSVRWNANGELEAVPSGGGGGGSSLTGVTAGAGLTGGGTTGNVTLSVDAAAITGLSAAAIASGTLDAARLPTASATTDGKLTSADWSTFSAAATTLQSLDTDGVPEGANLYFTDARAKAAAVADAIVDVTTDVAPSQNAVFDALALKQDAAEKGNAFGYAALDGSGKVPSAQLPYSGLTYQGTWNATTNAPALASGCAGSAGEYYIVSAGGSTTLDGTSSWSLGDWVICSDTNVWQRVGNSTGGISTVNGLTGSSITLTTSNVNEGSNLYFTNARARGAISGTGPLSYSSATGVMSIAAASSSTTGVLSSTDWSTFNSKQNAITTGTTAQYLRGDLTLGTFASDVAGTAAVTANTAKVSSQWTTAGSDIHFSTGKVGIGTPTPATALDVNGVVSATGLALVDGAQAVGKVLVSDAAGAGGWQAPKYYNQLCGADEYLVGFDANGDKQCSPLYKPAKFIKITAGYWNTCGILSDGTLKCWGVGANGRNGNSSLEDSVIPSFVRKNDGRKLDGVTDVSFGAAHACAVAGGKVYCWGLNTYGELGTGDTEDRTVATEVSGITNATQVSAGFAHSCARLSTGAFKCWGEGSLYRLGTGTTTDATSPIDVTVITNGTKISAGGAHTCFLKSDATVWCVGYNLYGQLGNNSVTNSATAVQVSGLTGVTDISASVAYHTDGSLYDHTCAIKSDGTAWCWGRGSTGQLGNGASAQSNVPVQVKRDDDHDGVSDGFLTDVAKISTGSFRTCAVTTDGQGWCWGYNTHGALGDGTTTGRSLATKILGVDGVGYLGNLVDIATNDFLQSWAAAIDADGRAYGWGNNLYGNLGIGTKVDRLVPGGVIND